MNLLGLLLFSLLLAACADIPGITPTPPTLPTPPPAPEEEFHSAEGSLWKGDASRRFLAFENRAKRIGDLVTVQIEDRPSPRIQLDHRLDFGQETRGKCFHLVEIVT